MMTIDNNSNVPPTIAAVIFLNMATGSLYKLREKEQPYFYLNTIGALENDKALVHNGTDFALVKVVRLIPTTDSVACGRFSKPLLAVVNYDEDDFEDIGRRIKEFHDASINNRVQLAIDVELGKVPAEELKAAKQQLEDKSKRRHARAYYEQPDDEEGED